MGIRQAIFEFKKIRSLNYTLFKIIKSKAVPVPIPVAERSKARVCGRSLAKNPGSNPAGFMDVSPVKVVLCQVQVSATR